MATPQPIPFGSKPIAPIPFGSKPIAPIPNSAAPAAALAAAPTTGYVDPGVQAASGKPVETQFGDQVNAHADAVGKIEGNNTPLFAKALGIFGQGVGVASDLTNDVVGQGLSMAGQLTNKLTGGIAGALADKAVQAAIKSPLGAIGVNAINNGADSWEQFAQKYPTAAESLSALPPLANLITTFYTGSAAKDVAEGVAPAVKAAASTAATTAKDSATSLLKSGADKTIEAVNPDLTGKKLASAYKEVVTQGREATPGGLIKEQALSPGAQAVKIGTRLHDAGIALKGKPVQDLNTLASAMKTTEGKINTLLDGDPEMVYNADKPTLINSLEDVKNSMPEEDKIVKDNGKLFNGVVDYSKNLIAKSTDTVKGLRQARTAFDSSAKKAFPSAFKEGLIDTKTPAGRAIKAVRDTINEHLYNTAPAGSEIKKLIGTEGDIYRATDNIAPKAAALHGTSRTSQVVDFIHNHPYVSAGVGLFGTAEAAKGLGL